LYNSIVTSPVTGVYGGNVHAFVSPAIVRVLVADASGDVDELMYATTPSCDVIVLLKKSAAICLPVGIVVEAIFIIVEVCELPQEFDEICTTGAIVSKSV